MGGNCYLHIGQKYIGLVYAEFLSQKTLLHTFKILLIIDNNYGLIGSIVNEPLATALFTRPWRESCFAASSISRHWMSLLGGYQKRQLKNNLSISMLESNPTGVYKSKANSFNEFSFSVFFVGLLFLNWHFGPSQLSVVTANSDQLSLLTSWGWTISPPHYFLTSALSNCRFGHLRLHDNLNNSQED